METREEEERKRSISDSIKKRGRYAIEKARRNWIKEKWGLGADFNAHNIPWTV